ncbi:MAG TPA: CarD family transcriptional regulator, partial [Gammaproteobacteria bacterium]|nr:CarD family transcriptional regulator [Gammaproteobacteria bacterium]
MPRMTHTSPLTTPIAESANEPSVARGPRLDPIADTPSNPSPLAPLLPNKPGQRMRWGQLYGSSYGLIISAAARRHAGPLVVITEDTLTAQQLEQELRFYTGQRDEDLPEAVLPEQTPSSRPHPLAESANGASLPRGPRLDPIAESATGASLPRGPRIDSIAVLSLPDWETLPYDVFSPHQDIISQRLTSLYHLPRLPHGILVLPVATLMHRLLPRVYLEAHSLIMAVGDKLDLEGLRKRLEASGYRYVSQVMEHGEFAVRGGLIDLFPMGSTLPYRIDLFGDQIDSIRTFDPENQRSLGNIRHIRLLPAREFPLTEQAITQFRQAFRAHFEGDPQTIPLYRDVSKGLAPPGIEYYLPLFYDRTDTLFDYLPPSSLILFTDGVEQGADSFWQEVNERYEQGRHDRERPLLAPSQLFLQTNELFGALRAFPQVCLQRFELEQTGPEDSAAGVNASVNYATRQPPNLPLDARAARPTGPLEDFLAGFSGRTLFAAETTGRRETLLEILKASQISPPLFDSWQDFLDADTPLGITVRPLEHGLLLENPSLAVIAETQLFGDRVVQRRRRRARGRDADAVIRNLTELHIGAPVVHEQHGVGRYLGLQVLHVGDIEGEFLALEYAGGDKLYVPVAALHLISRYTGAAPEQAPL